jgi:hypothetical protein
MPARWLRRCRLLGLSLCLLLLGRFELLAGPAAQIPVRVLTVTMAEQSLPAFLDHLRKFADANGFALRTAQTSPDATHVLAQLWREDIKGIGVNTSDTSTVGIAYSIALYRNCNDAVPDWAFDRVVSQLRETFSQMEGVTSVSEK